MNRNLNQALTRATEEIYRNLLGSAVTPLAPGGNGGAPDLSVIIGFAGEISGAFVLKGTRRLAAEVAGKMLGAAVPEDSDDAKDALGEFLNMIIGSAKAHYATFDAYPQSFKISVPTCVSGSDYMVHVKADNGAAATTLGFEDASRNRFSIEVYLK